MLNRCAPFTTRDLDQAIAASKPRYLRDLRIKVWGREFEITLRTAPLDVLRVITTRLSLRRRIMAVSNEHYYTLVWGRHKLLMPPDSRGTGYQRKEKRT